MCSFARHIILKHSPSMSISTNKLARDFKHSAASTPCPAGSKLISSFQTHFRFLPKRLSMKKPKIWADFFPREWRPCWIFIHCDVIEGAWGRALQTDGRMSRASGCLAYYYIDYYYYLSVYLFICLSVYLSLYLFISIDLFIYWSWSLATDNICFFSVQSITTASNLGISVVTIAISENFEFLL